MPIRGEVSVFRINGLTQTKIWKIGMEIADQRRRTLYGRGDTAARVVRMVGLEIVAAEPPTRHANIVGWPGADKARQKLLALQLAAAATLVLKR